MATGQMWRQTGRRGLFAVACLCALLCSCVYVVAFGSARGRLYDAQTIGPGTAGALPDVRTTSAAVVATIDVGSFLLLGGGVMGLALIRRRRDLAFAILVLLVGANATTWALKPLLARLDPIGGDRLRLFHGSFPSGHATVAMSLAAALVFAVPPSLKVRAALLGAAYAVVVGVSLMAQRWHYASDVAGGFLVAGAWACATATLVSPRQARAGPGAIREAAVLGILLAAVFAIAVAIALHRHPQVLVHVELHRIFVLAGLALAALAVCLTVPLAVLLERGERSQPTARAGHLLCWPTVRANRFSTKVTCCLDAETSHGGHWTECANLRERRAHDRVFLPSERPLYELRLGVCVADTIAAILLG